MRKYQPDDLVRLASGPVSPEALQAILADREALAQLAKLALMREMFDEPSSADDPDPADLPPLDVGFDELTLFLEGKLVDPERSAAASGVLAEHFPEVLPAPPVVAPAPEPVTSGSPSRSPGQEPPGTSEASSRVAVNPPRRWVHVGSLAASVLVAVGCVAGWVTTAVAKNRETDQLRQQRDDEKKQKEEFRGELDKIRQHAKDKGVTGAIPPVTIDTSRLELDRGREYSIRESSKPNEFVLQLSPSLGPPYYVGLLISWGDGSPLEEVYHHDFGVFKPLVVHPYTLPKPGDTRSVEVELIYRLSGHAMHKFEAKSDIIRKKIPLVLTSKGIRHATGMAANAISASVRNPREDGTAVPERFTLELDLTPPRKALTKTGSATDGDRMIYVLIRPLDGPEKLQRIYTVQAFTQQVSRLLEVGTTEQQLLTSVALPGAQEMQQSKSPGPREYEILVVEWPDRFVHEVVSKDLIDFDDEQLKLETVRARRVVRFDPNPKTP